MTTLDERRGEGTDPIAALEGWLSANWDPDLTVAEWWERLGLSGWSAPLLPADVYGRGMSRSDALRAQAKIASHGALGAPVGLGLSLAAPTIAMHGTREQVERFVRPIVTGQAAWCQLFSEPGAGSDLASLATRAVKDGDVWIVNGQKVWTSGGHMADFGMLLARTNPLVPKHQGITWFALDMHQPGVEVRTLREMTGGALFCEVFFTDAIVHDDARIGEANQGWRVANTTLQIERSGMGAGGDAPARGTRIAWPGSVAGDLDKRVGDLVARREVAPSRSASRPTATSPAAPYIELARTFGGTDDPIIRQELVRLHTLREIARLNALRHKAVRAAGGDIPGIANFTKLAMGTTVRLQRDLGLKILGARGMLHDYGASGQSDLRNAPGGPAAAAVTLQALSAQALPIFGGTDQIQRNIIAERALGLPKEPGDLSQVPFNELPRNG